jgi:hypothetical protein
MSTFDSIEPQNAIIIGGTILVIIASTLIFWSYNNKPKEPIGLDDLLLNVQDTWNSGEERDNRDKDVIEKKDEIQLKNVFEVKQPPPNVGNPQASSKGGTEKPFKSSYYYAHNQLKKTGGYTDGLKAEDYVMNGPKLLSKKLSVETTSKVTTAAQAATKTGIGNSIPINRYLWDDDGNASGIAKIYIETLPGKTPISFTDANISKENVMSKLVGVSNNGLILQIRRRGQDEKDSRYHLYVAQMFGDVEEVKIIVKAKKLIVKLIKKKSKENLKAWSQLPSKAIKSSSTDGVDYVNEDLFLEQS